MPLFMACSCAQRLFPEISRAIDEDADHGAQVPVAGVLFELDPQQARRQRHERCHDTQAAHHAPAWAPKWFPLSVLAWLGRGAFWDVYQRQHHQLGFLGNPFEIEARRAESLIPPVGPSEDLLTPVL